MVPAFFRGDLLFLTNYCEDPIRAGEIVVFKIDGRDIPIVHRVIKLHEMYVYIIWYLKNVTHQCYKNKKISYCKAFAVMGSTTTVQCYFVLVLLVLLKNLYHCTENSVIFS